MNKTILITGGAGYVGSHVAYLLTQLGYKVVIIDKLLHGQVWEHSWAELYIADFSDKPVLMSLFKKYSFIAIMHFAALIEIGESVKHPAKFYYNNVVKSLVLLDCMKEFNINNIIFSSSCAVYGIPKSIPITETHSKNPISPYGKNKLAIEFALEDYANAYGLKFVSLRYFNAAGALAEAGLGEQHYPETHLIPLLLRAIQNEKFFSIFGQHYKTPDGTCIRDYIHVLDIAKAHILALAYLQRGGLPDFFNLGSGRGFSVRQVIQKAEELYKKSTLIKQCSERGGDVDVLLADSSKAQAILGWEPKHSDLTTILTSALAWEKFKKIPVNKTKKQCL